MSLRAEPFYGGEDDYEGRLPVIRSPHVRTWAAVSPVVVPLLMSSSTSRLCVSMCGVGWSAVCCPAIVFSDGSCSPNPGWGGCGGVVRLWNDEAHEYYQGLGLKSTSVKAEFEGIIYGLLVAAEHGADRVTLYSDNQKVVEMMQGRAQPRKHTMIALHDDCLSAQGAFPGGVSYRHVDRDSCQENRRADYLANHARWTQESSGC
jgi:ribonuclease HI